MEITKYFDINRINLVSSFSTNYTDLSKKNTKRKHSIDEKNGLKHIVIKKHYCYSKRNNLTFIEKS